MPQKHYIKKGIQCVICYNLASIAVKGPKIFEIVSNEQWLSFLPNITKHSFMVTLILWLPNNFVCISNINDWILVYRVGGYHCYSNYALDCNSSITYVAE